MFTALSIRSPLAAMISIFPRPSCLSVPPLAAMILLSLHSPVSGCGLVDPVDVGVDPCVDPRIRGAAAADGEGHDSQGGEADCS